jgi:hypothetical protein
MKRMELTKKQRKTLKSLERAFKRCERDGVVIFASDSLLAMTEPRWKAFVTGDATEIERADYVEDVEDYGVIVDRGAP